MNIHTQNAEDIVTDASVGNLNFMQIFILQMMKKITVLRSHFFFLFKLSWE